jgi:hypothetical protein
MTPELKKEIAHLFAATGCRPQGPFAGRAENPPQPIGPTPRAGRSAKRMDKRVERSRLAAINDQKG